MRGNMTIWTGTAGRHTSGPHGVDMGIHQVTRILVAKRIVTANDSGSARIVVAADKRDCFKGEHYDPARLR
jgi:hypothetical protein